MKKHTHLALLCAVIVIGLLISPVMAVAAPGEDMYRPFNKAQEYPDIDGNLIVWEDDRYDELEKGVKDIFLASVEDIRITPYGYSFGTRITDDPASQEKPSISGDYIVWQDNRHGNWDIYLYQRSTGKETRLTTNTGKQWLSIVRGNYAAWYDDSSGRTRIVLYDIAARTVKDVIDCDAKTTIPYGSTEFKPALSEQYVAWVEEADWKVHYYDIAAGRIIGPVSPATAIQSWPSLSGSLIAWEDDRHKNSDIYMTDLDDPSGEEKRITFDTGDQVSASISGTLIAWEDKRVPARSIYMYDLSPPGEELSVVDANDIYDEHLYPAVSGDTIVWQRGRGPDSNLYIFVYESGEPTEPVLTTVEVAPATATLEVDKTVTFTATMLDQFDNTMTGIAVSWTSSNETVGTIGTDGVFTALAAGTATVTATAGEVSGTATVTVNPEEPVATAVKVEPSSATLEIGDTRTFQATVRDQFDNPMTGVAVAWTSSDPAVGTIDAAGLFTALAEGAATVTAKAGSVSGTAAVTVSAEEPVLDSIMVTPSSANVVLGGTGTFNATCYDQFGNPMTGITVDWTTDNAATGTIDASGTFTALAEGTVTVTATAGAKSAQAVVTVIAPVVPVATTIEVAPTSAALVVGGTQAFTATVLDQFDNPMTGVDVAWTSSDPAVGTIDANGLFTALAEGTATITATAGDVSGIASVVVSADAPVLDSITVTPGQATLVVGETRKFTTVCSDKSGNTMPGVPVAWSCSNETVGTIDANGAFAPLTEGTATITATAGDVSGTATVTVDVAESALGRVVVTPSAIALNVDDTREFSAVAFGRFGNIVTDAEITWECSDPCVGTTDANGLFTAQGAGTATITASGDGAAGTATVTVNCDDPVLTRIVVTPPAIALAAGETEQFTATALDQDGCEMTGVVIDWSCGDPCVGTIDLCNGLFAALDSGTATVTATAGGIAGTAAVTVTTASSAVVVSPSAITLDAGDSRQFTATVYDPEGNATSGGITWSCNDESVGTITAAGLFVAVGEGAATVTATAGNETGTATVTVRSTSPVLTQVRVSPSDFTIAANNTLTLTATAYDQYGYEMPGVVIDWTCSDPCVGTIDLCNGLFTALDEGTTTITASAGGISGSACVTVEPSLSVPTCIEVEPSAAALEAGDTRQFVATVFDQCDNEMDWVRVAWSCSDPGVGTIDRTGLFVAFAEGSADVTASAGDVAGTAAVTVSATTEPEPTPTPNNPGNSGGSANSGGGDSSEPTFCARTCGYLASGQTFMFSNLTTSSVGSVSITAANTIPKLMLTVKKATPSAAEPPVGDIYEYVEITLNWANPDDISSAVIEFTIPAAWLDEHDMLPEDIRLMRCVDGAWQTLDTVVLGEENGLYRFRATTPGFSTFAIVAAPRDVIAQAEELNVTTEVTGTPEATGNVTTEPTEAVPVTTPAAPLVYAPFLAPLAFLLWARKNH